MRAWGVVGSRVRLNRLRRNGNEIAWLQEAAKSKKLQSVMRLKEE